MALSASSSNSSTHPSLTFSPVFGLTVVHESAADRAFSPVRWFAPLMMPPFQPLSPCALLRSSKSSSISSADRCRRCPCGIKEDHDMARTKVVRSWHGYLGMASAPHLRPQLLTPPAIWVIKARRFLSPKQVRSLVGAASCIPSKTRGRPALRTDLGENRAPRALG